MLTRLPSPRALGANIVEYCFGFDADPNLPEEVNRLGITLPGSLAKAAPKRQIEWQLGRYCALRAIRDLGEEPAAEIPSRPDRSPQWPSAVIGSITHTRGFVAAAVASRTRIRAVGIDSETVVSEETNAKVRRMILSPAEEALGAKHHAVLEAPLFLTLLFSAKETLYKCLYPLVGRFFSYADAAIQSLDFEKGTYRVELLTDLSDEFNRGWKSDGKFTITAPLVHTGMVLIGGQSTFSTKR